MVAGMPLHNVRAATSPLPAEIIKSIQVYDKLWGGSDGGSRTPSGSQLQSVLDNSNPLYLSTGNPALRPSTDHSISLRDSWNGAESGKSFSVWSRASITRNRISRITYYAPDDDRMVEGIRIPEGGQLSRPVNLNGAWSLSMNATYTQPLDVVKSNVTLESGYSYSRDPGMVDEVRNTTSVRRVSGEFRLTSNVSEKVDFRLSQSSTYNMVNNEIQTRQQSNYFRHRGGASFRLGPFKGVTINSSFSLNRYNRLGSSQDTATEDWDAGISYRIPQLESVRIEWAVKDILNTGNNISHSENAQHIQSSASNVLGRHMLFLVRYELKEFRP